MIERACHRAYQRGRVRRGGIGLVVIVLIALVLYRPAVQKSKVYQATVVPLSNIMDVGFILFAPAIVLLVGFRAPFFMLGICLVAMATGFAMAYNIRHYEPVAGQGGRADRFEITSEVALLGASVVNIGRSVPQPRWRADVSEMARHQSRLPLLRGHRPTHRHPAAPARVRPRIRPGRTDQPAVSQARQGWMFAPALHHAGEFNKTVEQYPNIAPGAHFDGY